MSDEYSAPGRYLGRTEGTSRVQTPAHWDHLALGCGSCQLLVPPTGGAKLQDDEVVFNDTKVKVFT